MEMCMSRNLFMWVLNSKVHYDYGIYGKFREEGDIDRAIAMREDARAASTPCIIVYFFMIYGFSEI